MTLVPRLEIEEAAPDILAAALPGQEPLRRLAADVVADLARFEQCDAGRQAELAAVVREGFGLPADCGVRVLTCQTLPGPVQPTSRAGLILSVQVAITAKGRQRR